MTTDGMAYQWLNEMTAGRYGAMSREVEAARSLSRELGIHNARTVDETAARGGVRDGIIPEAEAGSALAVPAMSARKAGGARAEPSVLPHSESTFPRVTGRVGEAWRAVDDDVQPTLSWSEDTLERAVVVVAQVDRVPSPMARRGERRVADTGCGPRRSGGVTWHPSSCGFLVPFHGEGATLDTLRTAQVTDDSHAAGVVWVRAEQSSTPRPRGCRRCETRPSRTALKTYRVGWRNSPNAARSPPGSSISGIDSTCSRLARLRSRARDGGPRWRACMRARLTTSGVPHDR